MRLLISQYIEQNEGRRNKPYRDTKNKLTIGVGFNLDDVGLYDNEIDFILDNRIKQAEQAIRYILPDYDTLPLPQRTVLVDMMFNLGIKKFSLFKQMLAAVEKRDWDTASKEILNSDYAKELPNRAARNADLIKDTSWTAQ